METPSMRHSVNNPSAQEWEVHHKTIKKLYVEDDLSLEALQAHMDTKHDFLAGKRQYKKKFLEWGIRRSIKTTEKKFMILKQMQRKALQQKETQFKLNGRAVQDRKLMSLRKKMERQRIVMQEMGTTPESIAYCTPPTVTNNFLYPKYRQSTIETNPMNVLGPFSHEVSYINTSNITRAEDLGRFDHQNGEIFYMEMEDRDTLGSYLPLPRNLDEIDAQLVYMENLDILYESHISNTQENSYSVQEEAHREILAGFGPLMSLSEVDVLMSNT